MGYAIVNTNNNKQNSSSIHIFFPSDSLIKKKKKSTHSKIKYNNQNQKSKHTQKSPKIENIKKFKNLHKRIKSLNGRPLFCFFIVNFIWHNILHSNSEVKNNK